MHWPFRQLLTAFFLYILLFIFAITWLKIYSGKNQWSPSLVNASEYGLLRVLNNTKHFFPMSEQECLEQLMFDRLYMPAYSYSLKYNISASASSIPFHTNTKYASFFEAESLQISQCSGTQNAAHSVTKEQYKALFDFSRNSIFYDISLDQIANVWTNFSPSKIYGPTTDLLETMHTYQLQRFSFFHELFKLDNSEEIADMLKLKANSMNLALNVEKFFPLSTTPMIWLRVCKRTDPLTDVIQSLRGVKRVNETTLLVTIDCMPVKEVLQKLSTIDFMIVRIYFHVFSEDKKNLGFEGDSLSLRLNSHYLYGLRLSLLEFNRSYVITLEDDLLVSEDFFEFHFHLFEYANSHPFILSVGSMAHGPHHDCTWIKSKLLGYGECNAVDASVVFRNKYFPGWGSGIPLKTFLLFLSIWNFSNVIYDGILTIIAASSESNFFTLCPCKSRIKYIPNAGVNGQGSWRWDQNVLMTSTNQVVSYKVIPTPEFPDALTYIVTPTMNLFNISCDFF